MNEMTLMVRNMTFWTGSSPIAEVDRTVWKYTLWLRMDTMVVSLNVDAFGQGMSSRDLCDERYKQCDFGIYLVEIFWAFGQLFA